MSPKRQIILDLLNDGKNYYEICRILRINQSNLYSTIYAMRQAGINVVKRRVVVAIKQLSPTQRKVLEAYAQKKSVPDIAREMGVTCQTVQNHAFAGFKRMGLVRKGQDRIAKLVEYFAKETSQPGTEIDMSDTSPMGERVTMSDPAFN